MLPKRTYILDSDKSADALLEAIKPNTSEGSHWSFRGKDYRFLGDVWSNQFKISIGIGYKNDFRPEMSGTFVDGKPFLVHFRITTAARIMLIVFFSIAALISFIFLMNGFYSKTLSFETFIPLLALFFSVGMAHAGFWGELRRSKRRFEEATKGKLVVKRK
ncbi:MAG: hypothetical protein ACFHU9_00610 [Fluviicola sp.]